MIHFFGGCCAGRFQFMLPPLLKHSVLILKLDVSEKGLKDDRKDFYLSNCKDRLISIRQG